MARLALTTVPPAHTQIRDDSRRAVNLEGWALSVEDGHTYTFGHYRMNGRATVRVCTGIGRDTRSDM